MYENRLRWFRIQVKKMNTSCQANLKSTGCRCSHPAKFDGKWCGFHRPKSECSICLEAITRDTKTTTQCGHSFHTHCIFQWQATSNSCPMCRCQLCDDDSSRAPRRDTSAARRLNFDDEFEPILIQTSEQLFRLVALFF